MRLFVEEYFRIARFALLLVANASSPVGIKFLSSCMHIVGEIYTLPNFFAYFTVRVKLHSLISFYFYFLIAYRI